LLILQQTFRAVTAAPLCGLHHKYRWLTFGECCPNDDTMPALAKRFWHRFLAGINTIPKQLKGIVETDDTLFLKSRTKRPAST